MERKYIFKKKLKLWGGWDLRSVHLPPKSGAKQLAAFRLRAEVPVPSGDLRMSVAPCTV